MPGLARTVGVVLPDFRNLGVIFRALVLAEMAKCLGLVLIVPRWPEFLVAYGDTSAYYEPVLMSVLLLLVAFNGLLSNMRYAYGIWMILVGVWLVTILWFALVGGIERWGLGDLPRHLMVASVIALVVLWYFNWRYHVLSPALMEARLLALQARIRPHFLFNSLNTVLGMIRTEPRRAETVLQNLAELYRGLLSESGTLVTLGKELELTRSYAEIERLRLGPRLSVDWQIQEVVMSALVPPFIIQPLVENAIYHGIEPSETGGVVNVTIFLKGEQLNLVVRNPCEARADRWPGNRMALTNIRERLALHFDAEAEMSAYESGGEFVVQIRMPCRRG